ncbi:unnamed protein product [Calypogeia fissa]
MRSFWRDLSANKWLVLGAAIWIQACDGVGYAFGSYSPVIKSALGYSQKQISALGVAKDIGDSVGLLAGTLCDLLPIWGLFVVGALMNLLGYGLLWLIVTGQAPAVPFWVMCILICLATNGETFLNTGVLVACVRNFPQNRGGIVGILKGFTGLSGAIFTQLYTSFYAPEMSSFIFLVAVGPFMVTMLALFIVRPIPSTQTNVQADTTNFNFIYSLCLAIAAYLMGTMVVHDIMNVNSTVQLCFAFGLVFLLSLPLGVPFYRLVVDEAPGDVESAPLLSDPPKMSTSNESGREVKGGLQRKGSDTFPPSSDYTDFSEMEDEKMKPDVPERVLRQRLMRMRSNLTKAVAEGAVKVKRRKGPHRGEDFTLSQALVKADFWLLFAILVCGAGSGLTAIDNMGQIGESQGFANAHIFVSLISIWSFLGRIGAGWASEIIARDYAAPRSILLAVAQALMAVGHFGFAMSWPGSMYVGSLLVGFGYGCHWSVVPATASELFGLKNFGALYNVLTIAVPTGSLIFSGLIAGPLYDREAEKQKDGLVGAHVIMASNDEGLACDGALCFQLTFLIMTVICVGGVFLNLVLTKRTYRVYQTLYSKNSGPLFNPPSRQPSLGAVMEEQEEGASSSH